MLNWLGENAGTLAVGLLVAAVIIGVIAHMIKSRKEGKSSCGCGCGCSGCAMAESCHQQSPDSGK